MKDYYSILGVLPSAESAVIRGAYKAMLSIYHPDKYQGDKSYAHARVLEIQEAYEVLKDPVKRAAYDATQSSQHEYNEDQQASNDAAMKADAELWEFAVKYHSELAPLDAELALLSPNLSMQFRLALLESKQFSQATKQKKQLEQEYLQRYFGNDQMLQAFARELLMAKRRDAAKELNKVVNLLGNEIDCVRVITSIKREFNIETSSAKSKQTDQQPQSASQTQTTNTASAESEFTESVFFSVLIFFVFLIVLAAY